MCFLLDPEQRVVVGVESHMEKHVSFEVSRGTKAHYLTVSTEQACVTVGYTYRDIPEEEIKAVSAILHEELVWYNVLHADFARV